MNHLLGRDVTRTGRAHLAGCGRCQKRMAKLDLEIENEAAELQGQRAGFALQTPAGSSKSARGQAAG